MPPRDNTYRDNNSSTPIDNMDHDDQDDDEDFDDDMSYDSEFDSEDDLDDAFGSFLMAAVHSQGEELRATRQAMVTALGAPELASNGPSPHELWKTFLSNLTSGESKVLKITDACFEKYACSDSDMTVEVVTVIQSNPGLTHVILGDKLLQHVQQVPLFQALSAHWTTLTYVKLVPGDGNLDVSAILQLLSTATGLTELELHNISLSQQQVEYFSQLLAASSLRQVYIFGIAVESKSLDTLFRGLSTLESLDELRLEGRAQSTVSTAALEQLLLHKQKWWRLSFDNLGLGDEHCSVIARMFARNEKCKAGDLLSLLSNPDITDAGFKTMFEVFFNKGRMGLIKVDDPRWVAEFDLVRSMNNLHGRLDVVPNGKIISKREWIDWVSKIGNQGWEAETKRLNYMWFALRQNPEVVNV